MPILRAAVRKTAALMAGRDGVPSGSVPIEPEVLGRLLDDEYLRSFIELDPSGDFMRGLVVSFTANSREGLAELRRAVGAGDAAALEAMAHQLKGTSGSLGVREMHRVCLAIEEAASAGALEGAMALVDRCEREFESGLAALRQFMAPYASGQ